MKPYYSDDLVTIFHARCEDVLPTIDPATVDLLLADPPYGIDYQPGQGKRDALEWNAIEGDAEAFDPRPLLRYRRAVLWGANNYTEHLPRGGWLWWDKRILNHTKGSNSDGELAWTNLITGVRGFRHLWFGAYRDSEHGFHVHPTQKPAALMRWIVERWTKPGDLILDPYMGSGPVAQACHELGRRYIGVELVEEYCRVAVSRLRQQVLNFGGGDA